MSTLDRNGLVIDRFPQILKNLETSERTDIDADLVFDSSGIFNQINNINSSAISEVLELLEAAYLSKRLSTATDKDLDHLGVLKDLERFQAARSFTQRQNFTGRPGTLLRAGTLFSNPTTSERFVKTTRATLTPTSCLSSTLEVSDIQNSVVYALNVSGVLYQYTSSASATAFEILTGLSDLVQADPSANWTAILSEETLVVTTSDNNPLNITLAAFLAFTEVTIEASLETVNPGRLIVPENTVTGIVSTIPGLTSITNPIAFNLGRLKEEDEEFRIRIARAQGTGGLGTPAAIESYILANVDNVGGVTVIENATSSVDGEGRPAHSYEVIVQGGNDDEVAAAVWLSHGAGIEFVGDSSVIYVDTRGRPRTVRFSRPTAVNIAIRITYTTYNEEAFTGNGEAVMREIVYEKTNALDNDKDIITRRYFGDIYSQVNGVDGLIIEAQVIPFPGDSPSGAWSTDRIVISDNEFASISQADVYIVKG